MTRIRTILLTAGLTGLACAAYAADTGATALLPADSASAFKLGASAADYAKMSTAAVTGQPFKNALRIEVTKKPQRSGDVTLSAPVDAAMATGDVLLVTFYMRSGTPAEATLDAGFRAVGSGMPGAGRGRPRPAQRERAEDRALPERPRSRERRQWPGLREYRRHRERQRRAGAGAPERQAPQAPGAAGAAGRGRGGFGGGQPALSQPMVAGPAWKKVTSPSP